MLFSVLVASYNHSTFLPIALKSIFSQTYTHWQIVIVDDCSTDQSVSILANYQNDARFKIVVHTENKGLALTKRELMSLADGEVMAFLDGDDALSPDALQTMVLAHQAHPEASLIYSSYYNCDENLQNPVPCSWVGAIPAGKDNLIADKVSHFATFKKSAYLKIKDHLLLADAAEDKARYFHLEEVGSLVFVPKYLYYYRIHRESYSNFGERRIQARYDSLMVKLKTCKRRGIALPKQRDYWQSVLGTYREYYALKSKRDWNIGNYRNAIIGKWRQFFGNPLQEWQY